MRTGSPHRQSSTRPRPSRWAPLLLRYSLLPIPRASSRMYEGEDVECFVREHVHDEMRKATDSVRAPYALDAPERREGVRAIDHVTRSLAHFGRSVRSRHACTQTRHPRPRPAPQPTRPRTKQTTRRRRQPPRRRKPPPPRKSIPRARATHPSRRRHGVQRSSDPPTAWELINANLTLYLTSDFLWSHSFTALNYRVGVGFAFVFGTLHRVQSYPGSDRRRVARPRRDSPQVGADARGDRWEPYLQAFCGLASSFHERVEVVVDVRPR